MRTEWWHKLRLDESFTSEWTAREARAGHPAACEEGQRRGAEHRQLSESGGHVARFGEHGPGRVAY